MDPAPAGVTLVNVRIDFENTGLPFLRLFHLHQNENGINSFFRLVRLLPQGYHHYTRVAYQGRHQKTKESGAGNIRLAFNDDDDDDPFDTTTAQLLAHRVRGFDGLDSTFIVASSAS